MRDLSPVHIIIVLAIILLLFGAKRLPDAARSVGKSMRIFKTEVKSLRDDDDDADRDADAGRTPSSTGDAETQRTVPAPLEGRSVDEQRRDQQRRDEHHPHSA